MAKLIKCTYCHELFYAPPSQQKRDKGGVCCSRRCAELNKTGRSTARFAGEPRIRPSNGYIFVATGQPYQKARRQHKVVAEKALGRSLKNGEVVHHINLDKTDNRNSNLLICAQDYHAWLHQEMARRWAKEHLGGK